MSLVGDIAQAYRAPVAAMERQVRISGEERILLFAFLFCFLTFVARLPHLAILAQISPEGTPFSALAGAMFVSTVLMAPLMMYLIAALSHLVLRAMGGQASWQQARLALMWAALVSVPFVLIDGAVKDLMPAALFWLAPLATGVVFLWQWIICLRVVEFPPRAAS